MNLKHLEAFLAANPSPVDVEVGKMYRVPCVRRLNARDPSDFLGKGWMPVIGPIHDDKEVIGVAPLHLHYDSRFLSIEPDWSRPGPLGRLGTVVGVDVDETFGIQRKLQYALKLRKCRRATDVWTPVKFTRPLEEAHRRCRIGPDGLCPHRGIPLALGARLQDGSTVCAGHGLRWSAEGELQPLEDQSPSKAALSEGFNAIGIERDADYFAMAEHRMNGAQLGLPLEAA
jgi:hypothetical protein